MAFEKSVGLREDKDPLHLFGSAPNDRLFLGVFTTVILCSVMGYPAGLESTDPWVRPEFGPRFDFLTTGEAAVSSALAWTKKTLISSVIVVLKTKPTCVVVSSGWQSSHQTLIAYAAINRQYFSRAPYRACVDPTAFAL